MSWKIIKTNKFADGNKIKYKYVSKLPVSGIESPNLPVWA